MKQAKIKQGTCVGPRHQRKKIHTKSFAGIPSKPARLLSLDSSPELAIDSPVNSFFIKPSTGGACRGGFLPPSALACAFYAAKHVRSTSWDAAGNDAAGASTTAFTATSARAHLRVCRTQGGVILQHFPAGSPKGGASAGEANAVRGQTRFHNMLTSVRPVLTGPDRGHLLVAGTSWAHVWHINECPTSLHGSKQTTAILRNLILQHVVRNNGVHRYEDIVCAVGGNGVFPELR